MLFTFGTTLSDKTRNMDGSMHYKAFKECTSSQSSRHWVWDRCRSFTAFTCVVLYEYERHENLCNCAAKDKPYVGPMTIECGTCLLTSSHIRTLCEYNKSIYLNVIGDGQSSLPLLLYPLWPQLVQPTPALHRKSATRNFTRAHGN